MPFYFPVDTFCSTATAPLFHIAKHNGSPDPCCKDSDLKTCQKVNVDPKSLASQMDISILDMEFQFSNFIEPSSFAYKNNNGDEAVITLNKETGNMFASVKTDEGKSYGIEKCHTGHVWKEFDMDSIDSYEDRVIRPKLPTAPKLAKSSPAVDTTDNTTVVTYSVMFYFTPEFGADTADIPGFIDQVIAETNQGYINSQIPVRVAKFCIEEATMNDISNGVDAIKTFREMKLTSGMSRVDGYRALLNTADAAALLATDLNGCGVAYQSSKWDLDADAANGKTVSITKKSCAFSGYTFGHELGHNFGADHDPDTNPNYLYDYGHAHLIAPGEGLELETILCEV